MKTITPNIVRVISLNAILASCLLLPLGLQTARAANENRGQLSSHDYKFAVEAVRGGMEEVALGQLAAQKAANPAVREFGQRMVQDHTQANQQLTQIVSQKGATLPSDTTKAEQREVDRLRNLSGADFDKAYMGLMVKDHKKDVKEFQRAAQKAKDTDLQAFASKTLPILQEHLGMAQSVESTVAGEKRQTKL